MTRRRPVPREWREEHHELDLHNHRYGHVRGGGATYRSGGRCACGALFGTLAGRHTKSAGDVRDDWLDHVEKEFYKEGEAS